MQKRVKLIILAAVVVAAARGVGLTLWLTSGSNASASTSHQDYARLFADASIMHTKITVLDKWPKPYQTYHDAYFHKCYEWWDKPLFLYNLCFDRTSGVLVNKELA